MLFQVARVAHRSQLVSWRSQPGWGWPLLLISLARRKTEPQTQESGNLIAGVVQNHYQLQWGWRQVQEAKDETQSQQTRLGDLIGCTYFLLLNGLGWDWQGITKSKTFAFPLEGGTSWFFSVEGLLQR
nr:uncharacterized protein LOC105718172 [Aotus nancymaae]